MISVGILTISTAGAAGQRADTSGDTIQEMVTTSPLSATVTQRDIIPDDRDLIAARLRAWTDDLRLDLILTTGGTGLSPTDVTPEATLAVLDRQAPGLVEAMRRVSLDKTPYAMLSRAVAGTRGGALIINLPGSPKGVRECLEVLAPVLPHAIDLVSGRNTAHG